MIQNQNQNQNQDQNQNQNQNVNLNPNVEWLCEYRTKPHTLMQMAVSPGNQTLIQTSTVPRPSHSVYFLIPYATPPRSTNHVWERTPSPHNLKGPACYQHSVPVQVLTCRSVGRLVGWLVGWQAEVEGHEKRSESRDPLLRIGPELLHPQRAGPEPGGLSGGGADSGQLYAHAGVPAGHQAAGGTGEETPLFFLIHDSSVVINKS